MTHHERFDGTGYPRRLKGDQIPLGGRIVALADVYDALTSKRVYKPAFDHQKARTIILEGNGTQFDPDVVQAFINREQEFVAVSRQFHDEISPWLLAPRCVRDSIPLDAGPRHLVNCLRRPRIIWRVVYAQELRRCPQTFPDRYDRR